MCLDNDAEQILEQVELVGCKVVEIAPAVFLRLQSPGSVVLIPIVVELVCGYGKAYLNAENLADDTAPQYVSHGSKVRQIAPIVGYEAGNPRLFGYTINANAVLVRRCQGLFYEARLARTHCHDGVCSVCRGRSGYVYGIDIGVFYHRLRIGVPVGHAIQVGIGAGIVCAPAEYGFHMRLGNGIESGARLAFRCLSQTNKSPRDVLHCYFFFCKNTIFCRITRALSTNIYNVEAE